MINPAFLTLNLTRNSDDNALVDFDQKQDLLSTTENLGRFGVVNPAIKSILINRTIIITKLLSDKNFLFQDLQVSDIDTANAILLIGTQVPNFQTMTVRISDEDLKTTYQISDTTELDILQFRQTLKFDVDQTLTFDVDQVMFTDNKKNVKLTSIDVEVLSNFPNSFSTVIPMDAQIALILEVESSDYIDAINAPIINIGQQIDRTQQITIFDNEDILQILNKNSLFKAIYKFMERSINKDGLPANDIQIMLSKTPIQASRSFNLLTNTDTVALAAQLNNISYDQLQFVDHSELDLAVSINNFDPKQLIKAIQTFKDIFLTTNNVKSINAKTIFNKFNKFNKFNTFNTWAKIVHVYDGDTVNAVFTHPDNSKVYKYKLRLAHIDTPELNSKNPNEVKKANEAKKIVEEMILNKIVFLELEGEDKYDRLLANIYIDGLDLNEYLIEKNYAYSYEGGWKNKELLNKLLKQ